MREIVMECPVCSREKFGFDRDTAIWNCENCKFNMTAQEVIDNVSNLAEYIERKHRLRLEAPSDTSLKRIEQGFNKYNGLDIFSHYGVKK